MSFTKRLFYFAYEFADLLIFLMLWASLWYIYDYIIERYIGADKEKVMRTNIIVFALGVILLFIKHTLVKSPYVGQLTVKNKKPGHSFHFYLLIIFIGILTILNYRRHS